VRERRQQQLAAQQRALERDLHLHLLVSSICMCVYMYGYTYVCI
jgi:hypothetical protein